MQKYMQNMSSYFAKRSDAVVHFLLKTTSANIYSLYRQSKKDNAAKLIPLGQKRKRGAPTKAK